MGHCYPWAGKLYDFQATYILLSKLHLTMFDFFIFKMWKVQVISKVYNLGMSVVMLQTALHSKMLALPVLSPHSSGTTHLAASQSEQGD